MQARPRPDQLPRPQVLVAAILVTMCAVGGSAARGQLVPATAAPAAMPASPPPMAFASPHQVSPGPVAGHAVPPVTPASPSPRASHYLGGSPVHSAPALNAPTVPQPTPSQPLQLAARPSYPAGPMLGPGGGVSSASEVAPHSQLAMRSQGYAESTSTPYQSLEPIGAPAPEFAGDTCCEPLPGCFSSLGRLIYHPPALGCGQFGCQRLWGDPNLEPDGFTLAGLARGYFLDDQRLQWSGLENTFGAEAALNPRYVRRAGNWLMRADGIFFLNQPFERNILIDENRASYAANFYPDVFQIWQLNLGFTRGDFTVVVGKDRTPFGRYYFPIYSNSFFDAPFIRTEVIKWQETGVFLRYSPGPLNLEAALTNGGVDRDTNSSKALVCRAGFDTPFWALGVSGKIQDGTGSEHQKLNNSYYGFDAMARWGRFELSGEAVWDRYGLREVYDPNDIFWGRSIYYREIYNGTKDGALHGFGYYLNLAWTYGRLRLDLNYGEYFPDQIGNPLHDALTARMMGQASLEVMPGVQTFLVLMGENDRPKEEWRKGQSGFTMYTGVQWLF